MIEGVIAGILRADSALQNYISTYKTYPSVFVDVVPERADFPNITVRVQRTGGDLVIEKYLVHIDYWDYEVRHTSRSDAKKAAQRIESLLDGTIQKSGMPYHTDLRLWLSSPNGLQGNEANKVQYRLSFEARAVRRQGIDYKSGVTTTEEPTTTSTTTTTAPTTTTTIE